MAVKVVRDVLVADSGVTALVGTRISPSPLVQDVTMPSVGLQRIAHVPQNTLRTDGNLDANRVQLDAWATTYAQSRDVATACRAALQTAGHQLELESDDFDPEAKLYRVIQDWSIWQ